MNASVGASAVAQQRVSARASIAAGVLLVLWLAQIVEGAEDAEILGVVVTAMAVGAIIGGRPALVGVMLATAFVAPSFQPALLQVGSVDVRVFDGALFLWMVFTASWIVVARPRAPFSTAVGDFLPVWIGAITVGLSLLVVAITLPSHLSVSLVSFLRLVVTMLLVVIVPLSAWDTTKVKGLLGVVVLGSAASVFVAVGQRLGLVEMGEISYSRFGGVLGYNALGIPSGLLVLAGVVAYRRRVAGAATAAALILVGAYGLVLSASISSALAAAVSVGAYLLRRRGRLGLPVRRALVSLVLVSGFTYFVMAFRPGDVTGVIKMDQGSVAHRMMLAYAGLVVFAQNPIVGVGWQASGTEEHIGSPAVAQAARAAFAFLPDEYFTDVNITSVHNFYVQMAAETGLLGVAALAWVVWRIRRAVQRIVARAEACGTDVAAAAEFSAHGLLLIAVWLNTNPMFGGQTETIIAFALLGCLAAIRKAMTPVGAPGGPRRRV